MTESMPTVEIGQLVSDHHAAVYRYAFRLTGAVCDAEDLTQQTFLAAHQSLNQLRRPENARAWLFTILRNTYGRLGRKRQPLSATPYDIDLENIPDDLPNEPLIDPQRLQEAIDELPDDYKLVVLLFYFEECSYREIAERLSVPPGTVMSRLARAKARLRTRLFETEEAPVASAARPD
ncbi:MAG TPA: sigma-70 family RNA polymerase sigma factor [Pirellulales bacterium]|nr:sigma-70 family RNA polymerase sigma factor [Pirellulales bacterium]